MNAQNLFSNAKNDKMVQLYVGVGEGVAEGGVDDHEQNDAAHRPKRRLPAVQTLSQEPPAHLHAQNGLITAVSSY